MIWCEKCQWQPVPEKDLPVQLPFIDDYKPSGDGQSPLAKNRKWTKSKCPNCGGKARRETDVSDTFLDSAWYFLRYPSIGMKNLKSKIKNFPWDSAVTKRWLPVDMYIGGHEHAVLHLMYSRFVTMALKDMGYIDFEEPFKRFFAHGLMLSEGSKMSKSKGNVVNPNEYLDQYGADTLRLYVMFMGPYDAGGDFRSSGIAGMHRFLGRVWKLVKTTRSIVVTTEELTKELKTAQHKTIKKVSEDVSFLRFNTAIASLMEYCNALSAIAVSSNLPKHPKNPNFHCSDWDEAVRTLLLLLSPFAPFITEELWSQIAMKSSNSIHSRSWPEFDPSYLIEDKVEIVIQMNGKVKNRIEVISAKSKERSEVEKLVLENPKVQELLNGKRPKNMIFVPGKLVNIVL
jgi:leucyl-tRNA synthetase